MRKNVVLLGLGFIFGPIVGMLLFGVGIFLVVYFGGTGGIIAGAVGGTIGGALCLALSIILIMVGIIILIIGAVLDPAVKEN